MRWQDEKIYKWALQTFGEHSPLAIAIRGNKEMSELLSALMNEKYEEAAVEAADVYIFLAQVHYLLYVTGNTEHPTLIEEARAKMDINVDRQWMIASDGSHQHVGE